MGKRSRPVTAFVALLMAASVVAVSLSGSAGAGQVSGEPLKFGFIDMLPGEIAGSRQALDAYVDDWNKRGGHDGRPIQIVFRAPTSFSASAFLQAVNEIIDEQVLAFIGLGVCAFALPAIEARPIPAWGKSETCGQDDAFMFAPSAGAPTLPMLKFAIDEGSKVFAVLCSDMVPGIKQQFVDPLQNYVANHPEVETKVVYVPTPFPGTAADIDGAIATMKSQGVDSLFYCSVPDSAVVALEEARNQGFGPEDGIIWIHGPNLYDPAVVDIPALQGTFALSTSYPWEDTSNPEIKKLIKSTRGKLEKYDGAAQLYYAQAGLLENSLKRLNGDVTSESLQAHWEKVKKVKLPLTPLKVQFAQLNKNPAGGTILEIKEGGFEIASDFLSVPANEFN